MENAYNAECRMEAARPAKFLYGLPYKSCDLQQDVITPVFFLF